MLELVGGAGVFGPDHAGDRLVAVTAGFGVRGGGELSAVGQPPGEDLLEVALRQLADHAGFVRRQFRRLGDDRDRGLSHRRDHEIGAQGGLHVGQLRSFFAHRAGWRGIGAEETDPRLVEDAVVGAPGVQCGAAAALGVCRMRFAAAALTAVAGAGHAGAVEATAFAAPDALRPSLQKGALAADVAAGALFAQGHGAAGADRRRRDHGQRRRSKPSRPQRGTLILNPFISLPFRSRQWPRRFPVPAGQAYYQRGLVYAPDAWQPWPAG